MLDDLGRAGTPVPVSVIASQAGAERRGFTGSPTVLIDGTDPFAEPGCQAGLAGRVYATPAGLAGLPDPAALRDALRATAAASEGRSR